MKKNLIIFLIFIWSLPMIGQNKKAEVQCGDKVESTFKKRGESQDFYIQLDAGDNLKIYSSAKYGDYLQYYIDYYDPDGTRLGSTYSQTSHNQQLETGLLPATGKYLIRVIASRATGDYVTEFVCEKSNGKIISSKNKVSPKGGDINPDKTEFLSVSLGTLMKGEIIAGSNQLFGFKTEVERNTKATLEFSITKGSTPLEIQVFDPSDKSIVFFSSLGQATSMQIGINFSKSSEYIISIKESTLSNKRDGKTEFQVILK